MPSRLAELPAALRVIFGGTAWGAIVEAEQSPHDRIMRKIVAEKCRQVHLLAQGVRPV